MLERAINLLVNRLYYDRESVWTISRYCFLIDQICVEGSLKVTLVYDSLLRGRYAGLKPLKRHEATSSANIMFVHFRIRISKKFTFSICILYAQMTYLIGDSRSTS